MTFSVSVILESLKVFYRISHYAVGRIGKCPIF